MNRNLGVSAALTACLFFGVTTAIPAGATLIPLQSTIDGLQANAGAGTGSAGTGLATMTLEDTTNLFSWDISWSNLSGPVTVAHFHGPALTNQNAGVQVNFFAIAPGNPSIGNAVINAAQAADLLAGLWYINIHTAAFPGGEIRGQVRRTPNGVPAPATLALFGLGLAGLGWSKRKKV